MKAGTASAYDVAPAALFAPASMIFVASIVAPDGISMLSMMTTAIRARRRRRRVVVADSPEVNSAVMSAAMTALGGEEEARDVVLFSGLQGPVVKHQYAPPPVTAAIIATSKRLRRPKPRPWPFVTPHPRLSSTPWRSPGCSCSISRFRMLWGRCQRAERKRWRQGAGTAVRVRTKRTHPHPAEQNSNCVEGERKGRAGGRRDATHLFSPAMCSMSTTRCPNTEPLNGFIRVPPIASASYTTPVRIFVGRKRYGTT